MGEEVHERGTTFNEKLSGVISLLTLGCQGLEGERSLVEKLTSDPQQRYWSGRRVAHALYAQLEELADTRDNVEFKDVFTFGMRERIPLKFVDFMAGGCYAVAATRSGLLFDYPKRPETKVQPDFEEKKLSMIRRVGEKLFADRLFRLAKYAVGKYALTQPPPTDYKSFFHQTAQQCIDVGVLSEVTYADTLGLEIVKAITNQDVSEEAFFHKNPFKDTRDMTLAEALTMRLIAEGLVAPAVRQIMPADYLDVFTPGHEAQVRELIDQSYLASGQLLPEHMVIPLMDLTGATLRDAAFMLRPFVPKILAMNSSAPPDARQRLERFRAAFSQALQGVPGSHE